VRGQHVVQSYEVSFAPGKSNGIRFIDSADMIDDRVLDRRAIALINMPWQILRFEYREQRFANIRIEAAHVVQLHLVEERHLTRARVPQHAATALTRAQPILADPFTAGSMPSAVFLDHTGIIGLKEVPPAYVKALAKIAYIHQTLVLECVADRRIDLLIDTPAVDNGRTATVPGGEHAEEADARRPTVHVGGFVVVQDRLVLGIRGRGVNLAPNAFAGQIAIVAEELFAGGRGDALESGWRCNIEAAEQDAAVQVKLLVDVFPIVTRPVGKVDLLDARCHDQRERLILRQLTFTYRTELT
jgi:hypothetical protein